jgi:trehalose 6-phosphate synthase
MISRVAPKGATVWVHDYHLLLVPKLLRARRPDVRIGLFLHIPFPNAQLFSMLPWRQEVLAGMLGADLVGFQVADDADNFTATAQRLAGAQLDGTRLRVGSRRIEVDAFPISIDFARWDALGVAAADEATAHRAELGGDHVFLGIDRLDYTKGITQRLQAFGELLDEGLLDTEHCTFVQVAVPSRSDVPAYQDERIEVEDLVAHINETHRRPDGTYPLMYIESSFDDTGLAGWYRAADALVVTSLADGMNLVAKEFVAARSDLGGVVIISEFAGAARDLEGALVINPYDIEAIKRALVSALALTGVERQRRMEAMRATVRSHDVHHWARHFLERLEDVAPAGERARSMRWRSASSRLRGYLSRHPRMAVPRRWWTRSPEV